MKLEQLQELVTEKFTGKFEIVEAANTFGSRDKLVLRCPEHGEFSSTWEKLNQFASGCRKCRVFARHSTPEENLARFTEKLPKGNLELFDYSGVRIEGNLKDKVSIRCKACTREFEQRAQYHLNGGGCPYCTGRLTDTQSFVHKAKLVHGGRYSYDKAVYTDTKGAVIVTCRDHGDFEVLATYHLNNKVGCPVCSRMKLMMQKSTLDLPASSIGDYRRQKFRLVHGENYEIDEAQFDTLESSKTKITIVCREHGPFEQTIMSSLQGQGCPRCVFRESKAEIEIADYLRSRGLVCETQVKLLGNQEVDIWIPSHRFGIEFNGLYWHSEDKGKSKSYHLDKTLLAYEQNFRLVQVFEDEYKYSKDKVLSRLSSLLGLTPNRYFARRLSVNTNSPWSEVARFLDSTHLQGSGFRGHTQVVLEDSDNRILAAMTFGAPRFDGDYDTELLRYASSGSVVGGFSKLLCTYRRLNPGKSIVSYADARWSNGDVYRKNGFSFVSHSEPGYYWAKGQRRYNRMGFQKHKLKDLFPDSYSDDLTADEICRKEGYVKVYDCGQLKFELR